MTEKLHFLVKPRLKDKEFKETGRKKVKYTCNELKCTALILCTFRGVDKFSIFQE